MKIYLEETTGKINGLNALRFLGALSVIFLHLGSFDLFNEFGFSRYHRLVSGTTGVVLFYVISGFLITSLAIDEISRSGDFNFIKFIWRRAIRLFPLYYLAILVIFSLSILQILRVDYKSWFYVIFYAYNYVPRLNYNGNLGSFHTLATEEQFYLLYGFLIYSLFSFSRGRYKNCKILILFIFLTLLLFLTWKMKSAALVLAYANEYFVDRWLIVAASPLLVGCIAAIVVKQSGFRFILKLLTGSGLIPSLFFGSMLGFGTCLYIYYALYSGSIIVLSVGFSLIVCSFYLFRENSIVEFLELPVLSYFGKISYGLYVWQAVLNGTGPSSRLIGSPVISTFLVFLISILSFEMYEKRFFRYKRY